MTIKSGWRGISQEVHNKKRRCHCSMCFDLNLRIVSIHILGEVKIDEKWDISAAGFHFDHEIFWIDVPVKNLGLSIHFTMNWTNSKTQHRLILTGKNLTLN